MNDAHTEDTREARLSELIYEYLCNNEVVNNDDGIARLCEFIRSRIVPTTVSVEDITSELEKHQRFVKMRVTTHEPKDPAGDHFPDFHHDHLKALESRIESIVAGQQIDLDAVKADHRQIWWLLSKQRAINEAYLHWIADSADNQLVDIKGNDNLNAVVTALREALK